MKFTARKRRNPPAVIIVSLIDVLMVVLIFLMLSTTYSKFTELQVTLPTADAQAMKDRPAEIIVAISSDGRYAIDSQPVEGRSVDLLAAVAGQIEAGIQAVVDGGARIFVAGLGIPRDVIDFLHSKNVLVGSMCGKVRHAIGAVESGCDFVVAQGTEAGGHTGHVATLPLVPQVVDAVGQRVPVVAAGGIFDGRGLAAALSLGADGVCVLVRHL